MLYSEVVGIKSVIITMWRWSMSKIDTFRESVDYLNEVHGGDWFWNVVSQRFEDYFTDRSFKREEVEEK
jgi:hypothetical protein